VTAYDIIGGNSFHIPIRDPLTGDSSVGEEEKDSVQEPEIPEEGLPLELDEEQIPGLIPAEKTLPETLVIIPQLQRPVYPGLMFPLLVPSGRLVGSISYAAENNHQAIGLLSLQKDDPPKELREIDFYRVGTSARMLKVAPGPDGGMNVLINTYQRFRIEKFLRLKPHILVKVQYLKEEYDKQDKELKALSIAIMGQIKLLSRDNPLFGEELRALIGRVNTDDPARLADLAISLTNASKEELQKGLETLDVRWRMELALTLLIKDVELVQLQQKIHRQIEEKITKQQRDFFLREQLKAIKQELGLEQDQKQAEIGRFQDLVKKTKFSEEGKKRAEEELDKLSLTDMSSPEFNVSRNYLDWLVSLPWGKFSKEILDIKKARKILDEDHYGLDDVKQRIVEFIAVRKQKKNTKGSILCQPGDHVGRDRQGGGQLSGGSLFGVVGGAGPGTELQLPGLLPGRSFRSFQRSVYRHRKRPRHHSLTPIGSDGGPSPVRIHHPGKSGDRTETPGSQTDERTRTPQERSDYH